MQIVKLSPDDVLKAAGGYRDEVKIVCPVCEEVMGIETGTEETGCDGCGTTLGIEAPFS